MTVQVKLDQLQFPAVQVPSADPNNLDDYEEGTWVPVLRFGGASVGITYTTQMATYTKIGRLVVVHMRLTLSSKGSSTGTADISGLPFASSAGFTGSAFMMSASVTLTGQLMAYNGGGASTLPIYFSGAGGFTQTTDAAYSNTSDLVLTFSYIV